MEEKDEFYYCWLHDTYQHPSYQCDELWELNGIEAYIWAKVRRRCTICGHKEHKLCPYQRMRRCAVEACRDYHTTLNCMKRKSMTTKDPKIKILNATNEKDLISFEDMECLNAEEEKDLICFEDTDGLSAKNNGKLIAEGNQVRTKLSIQDDPTIFKDIELEINRDHSDENEHQNFNFSQCPISSLTKQMKSDVNCDNADPDERSKPKLNPFNLNKILNSQVKHKKLRSNQDQSLKLIMRNFKASKKFKLSNKVKHLSHISKSKQSNSYESESYNQMMLEGHDSLTYEVIWRSLSLIIYSLSKILRKYRAIHKLRQWKYKEFIFRIFWLIHT